MKVTITSLTILLLLCCFGAFAQKTYTVKGSVVDSVSNTKLLNASVTVLQAKDSILRKFTRANATGGFTIPNLGKGNFILLITYPGYADYVEKFSLDSVKSDHNFGSIDLKLKSRLLKEVIIKGQAAAIKIKGDTTEFNAKAFKIEPNSKVEDLLRQLPGIQVDKDGKITAQGQSVPKVLVDGEEFFGDDPTLVTKNIRADMVDKVQLYDKKSDQATFTGIDDGEKTKTINIKLKEDAKNGYFGKASGGIGTDGYYEGQALFNRFKGKKKFSVYGTASNTGKTGLGWEDNNKLGSGGNMEFSDDGSIMFFGGGGDDLDSFDGRYSGQGIPTAYNGGVHYDDKFNKDKETINTNYKAGSLNVDGTRNFKSQNDVPAADGTPRSLFTNSDATNNNYMFRQKLDAQYNIKLDSMSNLKVTIDGTLKTSRTRTVDSSYTAENNRMINSQGRRLRNDADGKIFNATAFYTHKFKKTGRTFSLNLSAGTNENKASGFLNATTDYFTAGTLDSSRVIDQYKTNDFKTNKFLTNATYTEPLSKYLSVILSYGINLNNSSADRKSFNQSAPNIYNQLVDSLSSDYKFNQFANQGGANFNYKRGKAVINFGTKVSDVTFKQTDQETDITFRRHFTNWNPTGMFQYKFGPQQSFSLRYNGNNTQPSFDQIQPIRNNNDPLNLTLGNPLLRPSFNNRFNANYNSYKTISGQYISFYGSYSFTTNPIVNNVTTDTTGKNIIQYLNLSGKSPRNYYAGAYFDRKISAIDLNVGLSANIDGSTYYSLKNSAENETKSNTISGRLNINKYVQKKYFFQISGGPTYTKGQSSLNPGRNNNGRGFSGDARFNVYLPFKLQIGGDANYNYQAATQSFGEPFEQTIINANITKAFFKAENLKLVLSGNDLLNQNSGFSRDASGLSITQERYTTIRRYFLFSVVWDFNKMGGGAAKK